MEYMDAGSLDKLSLIPVPEPVLQRVTASMVKGLKFLKDALQIMHRGVCSRAPMYPVSNTILTVLIYLQT